MILADTSVWIDHLRSHDPVFADALNRGDIAIHPFILGELALGTMQHRGRLKWFTRLPKVTVARTEEVDSLIEAERLYGIGVGYVDVHLLASTLLTPGAQLWTKDRRLQAVAERLGIAAHLTH